MLGEKRFTLKSLSSQEVYWCTMLMNNECVKWKFIKKYANVKGALTTKFTVTSCNKKNKKKKVKSQLIQENTI